MKGKPNAFWAKLESDDDDCVLAWHPLRDHCADVAAVFEALLGVETLRRRLARLAGLDDLDDVTRARLCVLVALHDLGKANIGFQAKGRPELGTTAGHVGEAVALLSAGLDTYMTAIDADTLSGWGDATGELLLAALCHHGRPLGQSAPAFQKTWWTPRGGLDPRAELTALAAAARRWFPCAYGDGPPLPETPAFQHAFAGLVMLADWIGSDNSDVLFPFSSLGDPDRIDFSRDRARRALVAIGIDPGDTRAVVAGREPFATIAPGLQPRAAQRTTLALPLPETGSLSILEAETGSGKTEAALARFIALYAAGCVDGMVFALPTRTAATQIFERVVQAVAHAFPSSECRPPVVLAVPGYLRVDDQVGRRLPHFRVLWPDGAGERERYRGWAAETPKRCLAGPIVVGTVDQVLLSGLMVSHAHLRAAALLRHFLVVDEVHASDPYMTRILEFVLRRHQTAGGHALLLSATLAGGARARFLGRPAPSFEAATAAPYPLLSCIERGDSKTHPIAHDARERQVAVETCVAMEDPSAVARIAYRAAQEGAKVIVLRNTVAACLATQQELESCADEVGLLFCCNEIFAPHHSRYARDDRRALDHALERRLGKDRATGGCVVVATQTVQQSLDLDADLLVTDLCPIDVLLQRIGRLHRHDRSRPPGFEQARALLLVPSRRDLGAHIGKNGQASWQFGIGTVYQDLRVLEATWRLVERETLWRIPSMCRRLVEEGLHADVLAQIADQGGDAWAQHAAGVFGAHLGDTRLADLNVVDWSQPYANIAFPKDRRIPSRLGESDRRASFAAPVTSPFGQHVRELQIKGFWAHDVPAEVSEASDVEQTEGGFTFSYGPRSFTYDRYGLRPTPESKEMIPVENDDET